jgi:RNA recognition motif-containing protein
MQGSKLYVGNLDYSVSKRDLEELFLNYGEVRDVKLFENKGFGFVEMSNTSDAMKAMEGLNGTNFKGRNLKIDEARPQQKRSGGQRRDFRR